MGKKLQVPGGDGNTRQKGYVCVNCEKIVSLTMKNISCTVYLWNFTVLQKKKNVHFMMTFR